MNKKYYQVLIATPREQEAKDIVQKLLDEKLIACGFITGGLAMHWWKNEIDKENYWSISAYTVIENKDKIIKIVREINSDELPGIVFFKINDANQDFLDWIDESIKK